MAKQKNRQSFWAGMDERERMYFVLALCCAALLLTVIAAFFIVRGGSPSAGKDGDLAVSTPAPMVMESGYNKDQNTIDTAQYTTTILEESPDAGQSYLNETLFLGDSNTARMYRMFDYCTYDNAIGSVGMSARSLASYACVQFKGYSGYKTMPEAVALMQPRRVILTFGTNDLDPGYSASSFAENYASGIRAIVQAYPSVDIIVNAIPPLGQQHSNSRLTQSQLDEYNQALVEMCQENGWKFLNSAEVLKDSATGYARSGYVESSDGIHLTSAAMDALFDYIRTHSYITEDDRPALTTVPAHTGDKDVSVMPTVAATPQPTPQQESTPEPDPTPTIDVDLEIGLADINRGLIHELEKMSPFGPGNEKPVFVTRGVYDYSTSKVFGHARQHLKLDMIETDGRDVRTGIGFGLGDMYRLIEDRQFDICYTIDRNIYRGRPVVQLMIKDIHTRR